MKFHFPSQAHFRCHNSGFCCESFLVPVAAKEKEKLEKLPLLTKFPELQNIDLFQVSPYQDSSFGFRMTTEGQCHFLTDEKLCKIHGAFGGETKPMACQTFPYTFTRAPDGLYVGLRFSCPSVAGSKGVLLKEDQEDIEALFKRHNHVYHIPKLEREIEINEKMISWKEIKEIESLLIQTLEKKEFPFAHRLLLMLDLFDLIGNSLGAKEAKKRIEFWKILAEGTLNRAGKKSPYVAKKWKSTHRRLFLQMIFYFAQPIGQNVDPMTALEKSKKSVSSLIGGLRFMHSLGSFELPFTKKPIKVKEVLNQMTLLQQEHTPLVENYFVTKIESQSFFGPSFFSYSFGDGLNCLAMMYPVICWYAWAYSLSEGRSKPNKDDVIFALRCVDYNYGTSAVFSGMAAMLRNYVLRNLKISEQLIHSIPEPPE